MYPIMNRYAANVRTTKESCPLSLNELLMVRTMTPQNKEAALKSHPTVSTTSQ